MRAIIAFLFLLFLSGGSFAQVYSLNNGFISGATINTCTGVFQDSNRSGSYGNNENYTVTFAPTSTGRAIQLQFLVLNLGTGDTLWIHDGLSTLAPLITFLTFNDPLTTVRASATNTSGAIAVKFTSDNNNVSEGWSATISCKSACQSISTNVRGLVPTPDANGFINICKGQEVTFTGNGTYNQNDLLYHQTDTVHRFNWKVSDGFDTTGTFLSSFKHKFSSEGGFLVELRITDTNGCTNINRSVVKVRTGVKPQFNLQRPATNCSSDTVRIFARPKMATGSFTTPPVIADSIFLPDGLGVSYQTSLNITQFATGQTLNRLSDLDGILLNMEHSWLGDLEMAITAPNGVKVRLKYSTGTSAGWESFLGEPVDEPSASSPLARVAGKGYDYVFSPNPRFGTMTAERGGYRYTYVDNAGQNVASHTYLPAGSYASEESLQPLVGTPLNGLWTITITDKFSVDNGFIFSWTIKFNQAIYPTAEVYQTGFTSGTWSTGVASSTDTTATIMLNAAGTFPYTYTVTDGFGCRFDTTFNLVVNPVPAKPNLGVDTAICQGQSITVAVKNVTAGNTYRWSNGVPASSISLSQPGIYWVEATNNFGCKSYDTITVNASTQFSVSLKDTMYCATSTNTLMPISSVPISRYVWSNGSTGNTLVISTPGTYWVEGTDALGCKARDSNFVSANPVNTFDMPADTTICEGTDYLLQLQSPVGSSLTWMDGTTGNSHLIVPGNYSVQANYAGCIRNNDLTVGTRILPRISLGKDTALCFGFELPLSVSFPGAAYRWSTASTDSFIIAKNPGIYWAQATLNGCSYTDSMELNQRNCDCLVQLPNAFSPNGDGINDLYIPKIECFPADFKISVFNRYGQLVFETQNYRQYWNGTINGSNLPVGTYYYLLSFYNINLLQTEVRKGSITLLR
jgi:gliding motility-associated-like protein